MGVKTARQKQASKEQRLVHRGHHNLFPAFGALQHLSLAATQAVFTHALSSSALPLALCSGTGTDSDSNASTGNTRHVWLLFSEHQCWGKKLRASTFDYFGLGQMGRTKHQVFSSATTDPHITSSAASRGLPLAEGLCPSSFPDFCSGGSPWHLLTEDVWDASGELYGSCCLPVSLLFDKAKEEKQLLSPDPLLPNTRGCPMSSLLRSPLPLSAVGIFHIQVDKDWPDSSESLKPHSFLVVRVQDNVQSSSGPTAGGYNRQLAMSHSTNSSRAELHSLFTSLQGLCAARRQPTSPINHLTCSSSAQLLLAQRTDLVQKNPSLSALFVWLPPKPHVPFPAS